MGAAERILRRSDDLSELRGLDSWDAEEPQELDQWCVELDGSLACLSKRQVWMALARGDLGPATPVWRDGLGHWAAIADVPELTDDEDEASVSVPDRSEIRVRRLPLPKSESARWRVETRRFVTTGARRFVAIGPISWAFVGRRAARARALYVRSRRMIGRRVTLRFLCVTGALVVLALVGTWCVLHAPQARRGDVPRAHRVAVDVAEHARLVSARIRTRTVEQERIWWRERWR